MKGKPNFLVPIEHYFGAYYKALQSGNDIDISGFFLSNDDTIIPQRLIRNKIKMYKAFNIFLKEYHIRLEIAEVKTKGNQVSVILIESGNYFFNNSPKDIKTELSNIEYFIELKRINGRWKISYMDSNNDEYLMANEKCSFLEFDSNINVNRYQSQRGVCLNKVFDILDEEINHIKMLISKNNDIKESDTTHNPIIVGLYTYDFNNGINYARKYARYNEVPDNEKLFYYVSDNDCTNFMSQCVWAAYGGYESNNIEASKKNVANRNRMIFTGSQNTSWYGTAPSGGGTPAWENVIHFFNYVTRQKEVGPRGSVYEEKKQKDFNFSLVKPGHILQFWPASKNKWYHSCYVSAIYYNEGLTYIFVCQHTMDIQDRPLVEILKWNTNEGKIRGISFEAAEFNK